MNLKDKTRIEKWQLACDFQTDLFAPEAPEAKDDNGKRSYTVIDEECVGCNLCYLVCPVPKCITMNEVDNGLPYLNWTEHPNNPMK